MNTFADFDELIGITIKEIQRIDNELIFIIDEKTKFRMFHAQNCCETVEIEDIIGDLSDLIGTPILTALESTDSHETDYGSCTYTFYKLATAKGYVDIRWFGESNGYYSERVDCMWLRESEDEDDSM